MKLVIWVVFGIFESGRHTLALFLDENLAAMRRDLLDKHEDCLETQVLGFETDFAMIATTNELKPVE